jgi:hypothetical protein
MPEVRFVAAGDHHRRAVAGPMSLNAIRRPCEAERVRCGAQGKVAAWISRGEAIAGIEVKARQEQRVREMAQDQILQKSR